MVFVIGAQLFPMARILSRWIDYCPVLGMVAFAVIGGALLVTPLCYESPSLRLQARGIIAIGDCAAYMAWGYDRMTPHSGTLQLNLRAVAIAIPVKIPQNERVTGKQNSGSANAKYRSFHFLAQVT